MADKINPKIIVITGAECTGKSVLTQQLAEHFQVPYYPEFAREYISALDRSYTFHDVEIIARKQAEQFDEACNLPQRFVFFDTWLIITKVWFEVVFKTCPNWVIKKIESASNAGFILNDIDIPWIPDKVRENGGENRKILHRIYIRNLEEFGFKYFLNSGLGPDRLKNAIRIIESNYI